MKKRGTDITAEDDKKLQDEHARLQRHEKREKVRGDFDEEMVTFGKDVYGIDVKKVGRK